MSRESNFDCNFKYLNKKIVFSFSGDNGQRVQLVMVPEFSQSKSCILVNLRTLSCHQICVDISPLRGEKDKEKLDEKMEI